MTYAPTHQTPRWRRARTRYVALAVGTIVLGLAVHGRGDALSPGVRDVLGDALWAAMATWWISAIAPAVRLAWRAAVALAFCFAVEVSQLVHLPALDALRRTTVGHLVLGSGFDRRDFAAYAAGVLAAVLVERILDWLRRSRVPPPEPFPDEWASFLWDLSAQYRRLPGRLQTAFERDVQQFIAKQRITGVETEVDDRLRLLVAASAATLSVGWPGYKWSEVSEVLLYPDDFDRDYTVGRREVAGMAHVWGTVILSVPSLRHSFAYNEVPYHVGLHEFAHLLTYERGQQVKVPVGLSPAQIQLWEAIQADELNRLAGGESIVVPYALQPSEFFPCAVEAFFQKPIELRERHRRLYGFLSRYFRQSPAVWESRFRARPSG